MVRLQNFTMRAAPGQARVVRPYQTELANFESSISFLSVHNFKINQFLPWKVYLAGKLVIQSLSVCNPNISACFFLHQQFSVQTIQLSKNVFQNTYLNHQIWHAFH